jgi:hypothetical protein
MREGRASVEQEHFHIGAVAVAFGPDLEPFFQFDHADACLLESARVGDIEVATSFAFGRRFGGLAGERPQQAERKERQVKGIVFHTCFNLVNPIFFSLQPIPHNKSIEEF